MTFLMMLFVILQGSDNLENQGKPGKRLLFRGIREIQGKSLPNFDLSGKLREFSFADNFFEFICFYLVKYLPKLHSALNQELFIFSSGLISQI